MLWDYLNPGFINKCQAAASANEDKYEDKYEDAQDNHQVFLESDW